MLNMELFEAQLNTKSGRQSVFGGCVEIGFQGGEAVMNRTPKT
jgi:hypothetical protein